MNYIIFDLEFNQITNTSKNDLKSNTDCPFEIIQIGAVKLDENFNLIDKFNSFIKPQIYSELNPIIEKLTSININILNNGDNFEDVYNSFTNFVSSNDIFVVWGACDMKELFRNAKHYNLDDSLLPKEFIDIQKYASKYFNYKKGKVIGLSTAIDLLSISVDGNFHNALNDALYTSEIFKKLYKNDIIPTIYEITKSTSRKTNSTSKVDLEGLLNQFEKMLNRKITKEEKYIIKTAYFMGKTNQFNVD